MAECSADGCERTAHGHGLCTTHYTRLRRGVAVDLPVRRRVVGGLCSIAGCDRPHEARGYCDTHYARLRITGDVRVDVPINEKPLGLTREERFEQHINRSDGPDACHPWTASLGTSGYGQFQDGGTMRGAHVVAYELDRGHAPPPDKPYVLHTCDNPPCCNGKHLAEGTQAENIADMDAKGRRRK